MNHGEAVEETRHWKREYELTTWQCFRIKLIWPSTVDASRGEAPWADHSVNQVLTMEDSASKITWRIVGGTRRMRLRFRPYLSLKLENVPLVRLCALLAMAKATKYARLQRAGNPNYVLSTMQVEHR